MTSKVNRIQGSSSQGQIVKGGNALANSCVPKASTPAASVLIANSLCRSFHRGDTEVTALKGVSIDIPAKGFIALSGPSGSGKSTLLNILGLIDKPDHGEVFLQGNLINYDSSFELERLRREKLGFIFQDFNLIPVLTALENVEMPLLSRNLNASERRELAAEALNSVGLGSRQAHHPKQLSGGQQQRVAVARALVTKPLLVLADEPTANLDSKTTFQLLDLMGDINDSLGTTFLFSTHDPRILEKAKQVINLSDGEIIQ